MVLFRFSVYSICLLAFTIHGVPAADQLVLNDGRVLEGEYDRETAILITPNGQKIKVPSSTIAIYRVVPSASSAVAAFPVKESANPAKGKPIPSEAACAKVRAELPTIYDAAWVPAWAGGPRAQDLARILALAGASATDPAEQYTLLGQAAEFHMLGGDLASAIDQAKAITAAYAIESDALVREWFNHINAQKGMRSSEIDAHIASVTSISDADLAAIGSPAVRVIMDGLTLSARKSGSTASLTSLAKVRQDLELRLKAADSLMAAKKVLQTTPDDPVANHTIGCDILIHEGPTENAVKHLLKSGNPKFSWAAQAQQGFDGSKAASRQLFDAWSSVGLSVKEKDLAVVTLQLAQTAGERLSVEAVGLDKARIDKRLGDITAALEKFGPQGDIPGKPAPVATAKGTAEFPILVSDEDVSTVKALAISNNHVNKVAEIRKRIQAYMDGASTYAQFQHVIRAVVKLGDAHNDYMCEVYMSTSRDGALGYIANKWVGAAPDIKSVAVRYKAIAGSELKTSLKPKDIFASYCKKNNLIKIEDVRRAGTEMTTATGDPGFVKLVEGLK